MTAQPDAVHFIRGGRFVCTAEPTARCRNYPSCGCEEWSAELHGSDPAPGHEDRPQDECWIDTWLNSAPLADSHVEATCADNGEFRDGPIRIEWETDYVLWSYADEGEPSTAEED